MRVKRDFCLDFSKKISTDFLVCLAGKFPSEISILRRPPKYRSCQSFSTFEFQLNRISNLILHLLEEVTCELNFFRISIISKLGAKRISAFQNSRQSRRPFASTAQCAKDTHAQSARARARFIKGECRREPEERKRETASKKKWDPQKIFSQVFN